MHSLKIRRKCREVDISCMDQTSKNRPLCALHTESWLLSLYGPDEMAEWSRRETSEPGVLGSNPAQVSDCPTCLVWAGTLVTLYKSEGLFVVL